MDDSWVARIVEDEKVKLKSVPTWDKVMESVEGKLGILKWVDVREQEEFEIGSSTFTIVAMDEI